MAFVAAPFCPTSSWLSTDETLKCEEAICAAEAADPTVIVTPELALPLDPVQLKEYVVVAVGDTTSDPDSA